MSKETSWRCSWAREEAGPVQSSGSQHGQQSKKAEEKSEAETTGQMQNQVEDDTSTRTWKVRNTF